MSRVQVKVRSVRKHEEVLFSVSNSQPNTLKRRRGRRRSLRSWRGCRKQRRSGLRRLLRRWHRQRPCQGANRLRADPGRRCGWEMKLDRDGSRTRLVCRVLSARLMRLYAGANRVIT